MESIRKTVILAFLFSGLLVGHNGVLMGNSSSIAAGAQAKLDYTVGGAATYPGTTDLNITVTNTGNQRQEFAIFAALGNNSDKTWWGPAYPGELGYYRDGLSSCHVGNIHDEWWRNAFICTPTLDTGQNFTVTRKIHIPATSLVTDALVMVVAKDDMSQVFAYEMKQNVVHCDPWGPEHALPFVVFGALAITGALSLFTALAVVHRRRQKHK